MVDVRVLFWSITNKIYWEKILPITLLIMKISLPFYVMLILHLVSLSYTKSICKDFLKKILVFQLKLYTLPSSETSTTIVTVRPQSWVTKSIHE